ncbi:MAG: hypothetical protein AMJ53_03400 [Gammaproteobacteria bacterium SG8_11]|nr:MAG: hypothetical protein AMJ53_03400 [Gammaproteobacteria bacterium SG8_11]
MELNKKEKKELRSLVSECYEEHLTDLLEKLYEDFQKWGGKYIDVFELTDRIHEFHDKKARELYKMYVLSPPEIAIIYALRNDVIGPREINEGLYKKLNLDQVVTQKHDDIIG